MIYDWSSHYNHYFPQSCDCNLGAWELAFIYHSCRIPESWIHTCHLPSQLLIGKVSGGSWIHLTIAAKKIIKLGNCMAASLRNRHSSPNYGHKSRTICILQCCSFTESIFLVPEHKNILSKNSFNLWQILQTNHFSSCRFKNPMSS